MIDNKKKYGILAVLAASIFIISIIAVPEWKSNILGKHTFYEADEWWTAFADSADKPRNLPVYFL